MTLRMRATNVSQQDSTRTPTRAPQESFKEVASIQVCSHTIHFLAAFLLAIAVAWCMGSMSSKQDKTPAQWPPAADAEFPRATFAMGCFWGPQLVFERVPGVVTTAVGYTDGQVENPSYNAVCRGSTGHTEAVEMTYNPSEVSYHQLVAKFYENHDPTTLNRQKGDAGTQYRSGIYYRTDEERQIAEAAKAKVPGSVTEIKQLKHFWPAEDYHQRYLWEKGGRAGRPQNASKSCNDPIRCYG